MNDRTDTHRESTEENEGTKTVPSHTQETTSIREDSRAVADQLDFVTAMVVLTFGLSLFIAGVSVVLTDTDEVSSASQPAVDRAADRLTQDLFVQDGVSTSNRVSLTCISSFLAQNLSTDCGNISSLSSTGQPISTAQDGGTPELAYLRQALGLPDTFSANISIRDQSGNTITPPIGDAVSVRSQSVVVNNETAAAVTGRLDSTGGGQVTVKFRYTVPQTNTEFTIPVASNPLTGPETITQTVTGLNTGLQHTVRLIAEQNGTVQDTSQELTFTPLPTTTPSVSIQTNEVTNIDENSVEVSGTVTENDGFTDVAVQYETLEDDTPRQTQPVLNQTGGTGTVQTQLTGLDQGEQYRVRFIANGSIGDTQISDTGDWKQFQTDVDGNIEVTLDTITDITDTTAVVKPQLEQTGGETVRVTVTYQRPNELGSPTRKVVAEKSTPGSITATLTELSPDTQYINMRAIAEAVTAGQKTDTSKPTTFKTKEQPLPNIDINTSFTTVSDTGATVIGKLSDTAEENVDVFIEYTKKQSQLQPVREPVTTVSGPTEITYEITGIQSGVTYKTRYGATLPNGDEITGNWEEFELPDLGAEPASNQQLRQTQTPQLELQAKPDSPRSSFRSDPALFSRTDRSQRYSSLNDVSIPTYTLGAPVPLGEANPTTLVRPVIVELPSGEEVVWTVEITIWEGG